MDFITSVQGKSNLRSDVCSCADYGISTLARIFGASDIDFRIAVARTSELLPCYFQRYYGTRRVYPKRI